MGLALLLMPLSHAVKVTWETATEVDTAGFNVYRSSEDGEMVRINRQLIPARGGPLTGASYTFVDRSARPLHRYVYTLEEVERDGSRNEYPQKVSATAGPPTLPLRVAGGTLSAGGFLAILLGLKKRSPLQRGGNKR
jgi:hypothetical protein